MVVTLQGLEWEIVIKESTALGYCLCTEQGGMVRKSNRRCCCGCHKLDSLLGKNRQAAIGSNHWIQMIQSAYGSWNFAKDTTKVLLRTGFVWLTGFKLNTELAGVLGMISLIIAIQIWSTLWFFMDACLLYLVKGLATLGILFGMTVCCLHQRHDCACDFGCVNSSLGDVTFVFSADNKH